MKLDERLALINAGYTREEIEAFESEEAEPTPAPEQPAPEPEQKPEPEAPAPAPAAPAAQDPILEAINKLTSAVMAKNLNTTTAETLTAQTTQDILAKVIAPPKPQKKG